MDSYLFLITLSEFLLDPFGIGIVLSVYAGSIFGIYEAFYKGRFEKNKQCYENKTISEEEYLRKKRNLTTEAIIVMIFVPPIIGALLYFAFIFVIALAVLIKLFFKK